MFWVGWALGVAICGLPYLLYGAGFPPVVATLIALALAAGGLAVARPSDKWLAAAGVGVGILVPIIALIVIDTQVDPTAHNLAGIEVVMGLALGMPPALLGAVIGGFTRRIAFPRVPIGGAIAALGLVVAVVSATIMLSQAIASESQAISKMESLIAAQHRFRAANPSRGFTCNLNALGETFDAPAKRYPAGSGYAERTYATTPDYSFTLRCKQEPQPRTTFILDAVPLRQQGLGRWAYCAEADGRLRAAKRNRVNRCLAEGVPVSG
jgi:hypothetical protein